MNLVLRILTKEEALKQENNLFEVVSKNPNFQDADNPKELFHNYLLIVMNERSLQDSFIIVVFDSGNNDKIAGFSFCEHGILTQIFNNDSFIYSVKCISNGIFIDFENNVFIEHILNNRIKELSLLYPETEQYFKVKNRIDTWVIDDTEKREWNVNLFTSKN